MFVFCERPIKLIKHLRTHFVDVVNIAVRRPVINDDTKNAAVQQCSSVETS